MPNYDVKYYNTIEKSRAHLWECLEACVGKAKDSDGNRLDKYFPRKVADGIESLPFCASGTMSRIILVVYSFAPSIDMCLKGNLPSRIRQHTFYEHTIDHANLYLMREYSADGNFKSIPSGSMVAVLAAMLNKERDEFSRCDKRSVCYTDFEFLA